MQLAGSACTLLSQLPWL